MTPRICIVPEYPLSLMTGGVQVQAMATFMALRDRGGNVEPFEWHSTLPPADLYHFVGLPPYMASLVSLVRRKNIPYVCTLLCGGKRSLPTLLVARLRHLVNSALPGRQEYREAVMGADSVITITPADTVVVRRVFGLPSDRIIVIENGVDERFRTATPLLWHHRYGDRPFILCVGHIQSRKNQLFLLQVANMVRLPVVLIGSVMSGEGRYASHVESEVRTNTLYGGMWLRELSVDDPLLASAYAACRAYVLLSHYETQPLSVLEAMAAGKPILLGKAAYSQEYPFAGLSTTSRTRMSLAARDLVNLWDHGVESTLPAEFSWGHVADKLSVVYASALGRNGGRRKGEP